MCVAADDKIKKTTVSDAKHWPGTFPARKQAFVGEINTNARGASRWCKHVSDTMRFVAARYRSGVVVPLMAPVVEHVSSAPRATTPLSFYPPRAAKGTLHHFLIDWHWFKIGDWFISDQLFESWAWRRGEDCWLPCLTHWRGTTAAGAVTLVILFSRQPYNRTNLALLRSMVNSETK